MTLSTEYDRWHQDRAARPDPKRSDENSPWYRLVREYLGPLRDKRILEIACGRGILVFDIWRDVERADSEFEARRSTG